MSRQIIVHDDARFDVIDIAYDIAEDSLEASDRFAESVDTAFLRLAEMPGVGVSRDYGNAKLKGMRMWPVPGFTNYLIFYSYADEELHAFRALHGARDIESIFSDDAE